MARPTINHAVHAINHEQIYGLKI